MAGSFAIESEAGLRLQKAILDDTLKNEQRVVGEGDIIGDIVVEDIRYDRMSLRSPSGVRVLVMEFVSSPISPEAQGTNNLSSSSDKSISNRFGCVKVQDDRWQFGRQQMLDYYQELLDEPDRMVALFDTMKPVRDDRNRITGYVVGVEGERDFFDAVGLREGDIVRQVNSVAMTNRRRAEFFIDEFLKSRMSAIVLEVERDGKMQKQVYQVKE
jgi:type II secretory pathway component PulC